MRRWRGFGGRAGIPSSREGGGLVAGGLGGGGGAVECGGRVRGWGKGGCGCGWGWMCGGKWEELGEVFSAREMEGEGRNGYLRSCVIISGEYVSALLFV